MTNSKNTKRALLTSAFSLLICFAMLIGTTFAWFTDTASASINKIQAGNLDVQLLDADGNSLENSTLSWQKADGHQNEEVLWEPGCTYNLQPITIKNNGNLALKYTVVISGINGDAKLNEAIEWTIELDERDYALNIEHKLAKQESDTLTISGHMKETAGNEYKGLSIDGVAITVVATQAVEEYDSNGNTYDQNATYYVYSSSVTVPTTGDLVLVTKEVNPVKVTVPTVALTGNNVANPTLVSLRHGGVSKDLTTNTVKFNKLEIVDENSNVIDLSNNADNILTITLPVTNIANGTQVKVYHDGNLVAVTNVQDGKITYQVNHLCDVTVVAVDSEEVATSTNNENKTGIKYTDNRVLSNKKVSHSFNNTKRDAKAMNISGSSANVTFDNVEMTMNQGVRVTDTQAKRNLGVFVSGGASLTINSGTYNVNGLDTYFMWIQDTNNTNSTVTINGGTFKSNSQGALLACYSQTSKLVINGGFFDQSAGNANLTLQGGLRYRKGEIIVKGGTFVNFNPREHVAEGYKVESETQSDGKIHYSVVADN